MTLIPLYSERERNRHRRCEQRTDDATTAVSFKHHRESIAVDTANADTANAGTVNADTANADTANANTANADTASTFGDRDDRDDTRYR